MKSIRRLLAALLGVKNYLKLVSKLYITLTNLGFLKKKYPELFFLDQLIQPEWTCIDIGANLGYYSQRIGRKLNGGKLVAVEPIPLFAEIWKSNTRKLNCPKELLQIALGDEEKSVQMSIPFRNGVIRHGLTKIDDGSLKKEEKVLSYDVQLKKSAAVFASVKQLHFVKIDVEGFEQYVLSSMRDVLAQHKSIVQAELSGTENRTRSYELLQSLGYQSYKLITQKLLPITEKELPSLAQDVYFVHPNNKLGAPINF